MGDPEDAIFTEDSKAALGAWWASSASGATKTDDFEVYSMGFCHASVCTSLTPEEAEARLNAESPTGISSRWVLSTETHFRTGYPHPCPCNEKPETHKHYLFLC